MSKKAKTYQLKVADPLNFTNRFLVLVRSKKIIWHHRRNVSQSEEDYSEDSAKHFQPKIVLGQKNILLYNNKIPENNLMVVFLLKISKFNNCFFYALNDKIIERRFLQLDRLLADHEHSLVIALKTFKSAIKPKRFFLNEIYFRPFNYSREDLYSYSDAS